MVVVILSMMVLWSWVFAGNTGIGLVCMGMVEYMLCRLGRGVDWRCLVGWYGDSMLEQ
jgi:hypothetical protein